jgi:HAD superfamily hydrolase (TIGR01450 family)
MTSPPLPRVVTLGDLVATHAALFLDAYGVLVDGHGALPDAHAAIADLNARGANYVVLTNDASRLPETLEARFARFGLAIPRARIVSSGDLIGPWFQARGLQGARCVVLGSGDSAVFVRAAGGEVVAPAVDAEVDVVVVCDEAGYPFLDTVEAVMSMLFRSLDAGRVPLLLNPNPDLLYPKSEGLFGFTAGTVVLMLEAALAMRYPGAGLRFERLGKPHAPIFEEACRRAGTRNAVMIGDQLRTDVLGANAFGIASALITTGLTRAEDAAQGEIRPTYLLHGLR